MCNSRRKRHFACILLTELDNKDVFSEVSPVVFFLLLRCRNVSFKKHIHLKCFMFYKDHYFLENASEGAVFC